jgi:hypothetical protein
VPFAFVPVVLVVLVAFVPVLVPAAAGAAVVLRLAFVPVRLLVPLLVRLALPPEAGAGEAGACAIKLQPAESIKPSAHRRKKGWTKVFMVEGDLGGFLKTKSQCRSPMALKISRMSSPRESATNFHGRTEL